MRFRDIFLVLGSVLTLALLLLSDPDSQLVTSLPFGAGTLTILIVLVSSVLYIGLLHLARKALYDYLDLRDYFLKALHTSEGAGLALVAVSIAMVAIAIVVLAATS